jgi:hypothetical protein
VTLSDGYEVGSIATYECDETKMWWNKRDYVQLTEEDSNQHSNSPTSLGKVQCVWWLPHNGMWCRFFSGACEY